MNSNVEGLDMYLRLNVKARTKPKFDANEQHEEVLLLKEGVDVAGEDDGSSL